MGKRVKYYRAINYRYDLLLRLLESTRIEQFIDEFVDEVEGIITVAIFEEGLGRKDFYKLRTYATHMQKKARELSR